MKNIFESGSFEEYSVRTLDNARSKVITESYSYAESPTTVFISHKHDDLPDLKGIIGFLEKEYSVKAYIDSRDSSMPEKTSALTASNIKERIKQCHKFILLATDKAIESKWCNWELGYGDSIKYPDNIALFPIKPKYVADFQYKGSEYMDLYPFISYFDGTEKYTNGSFVSRGYYVCTRTETSDGKVSIITPLSKWLSKR